MTSTSGIVFVASCHPRTIRFPAGGGGGGSVLENLSDCSYINNRSIHSCCFWPTSSSSLVGTVASKLYRIRKDSTNSWAVLSTKDKSSNGTESNDDNDNENINDDPSQGSQTGPVDSDNVLREKLERMVGADDSRFSGIDLATLIRNKYGRSYDVQLIKKEFMGRNLLAMNVMWKYAEQRSFPLTEEEYILRLDDVANTLKCWGAVSHVRNTLVKTKERPRIGKAVSIFIDMDESGGRANEWIYK